MISHSDMKEKYIIGTSPVPTWCRPYLQPFRRLDGTCAVEYYTKHRTFDLNVGDMLIKQGDKIIFKQKERA